MKLFKAALLCCFLANSLSLKAQELTPQNTLLLEGPITLESGKAFMEFMYKLRAQHGPRDIYLVTQSPGGSFTASKYIALAAAKDPNLHMIIILAGSGAAIISQSIAGKVYIASKGQLMFHKSKTLSEGYLSAEELKKLLALTEQTDSEVVKLSNRRMKLSNFTERVKEDWYLDAEEAVKLGAVDGINKIKCSPELRNNNIQITSFKTHTGARVPTNLCDLL